MWTHCCRESSDPSQHITPIPIQNFLLQVISPLENEGDRNNLIYELKFGIKSHGERRVWGASPSSFSLGLPKGEGYLQKNPPLPSTIERSRWLHILEAGKATYLAGFQSCALELGVSTVPAVWVAQAIALELLPTPHCHWGQWRLFFPSYRVIAKSQEKQEI